MVLAVCGVILGLGSHFQQDESEKALMWMASHRLTQATVPTSRAFGVSDAQLRSLDDSISKAVIDPAFDFGPGKFTVPSLAEHLRDVANRVLHDSGIRVNPGLEQRTQASAIASWVRTHLIYNEALPTPEVPHETQALYWTSSTLLMQKNAWAVCAGFSRLTQDLSKELQLPCYDVLGVLRGANNHTPSKWTHSWNVYVFRGLNGESFVTPCDTTISRVNLKTARDLKGQIHHLNCFPSTPEEWGYFLWRQRCTANDGDRPVPDECRLDDISEHEWRELRLPVLERFIPQVESYEAADTVRVKPSAG